MFFAERGPKRFPCKGGGRGFGSGAFRVSKDLIRSVRQNSRLSLARPAGSVPFWICSRRVEGGWLSSSELFGKALITLEIGNFYPPPLAWDRRATTMNTRAFEARLETIRSLTVEQRQWVFRALALAEADDSPQEAVAAEQPPVVVMTREICTRAARRGKRAADRGTPLALVPVLAAANSRVEARRCPNCACQNLVLWGHASGLPRYRCGDCRRTFNALTGAAMANLRKKGLWADQAEALETGENMVVYRNLTLWPSPSHSAGVIGFSRLRRAISRKNSPESSNRMRLWEAFRSAAPGTQTRRKGGQTRLVRRTDPGSGRPQPERRHHRRHFAQN